MSAKTTTPDGGDPTAPGSEQMKNQNVHSSPTKDTPHGSKGQSKQSKEVKWAGGVVALDKRLQWVKEYRYVTPRSLLFLYQFNEGRFDSNEEIIFESMSHDLEGLL